MSEKEYYDLLLRTIRHGDYKDREELLRLLRSAYISFDQTSQFTRKSWQWYENVEIRVPPEYKGELEVHYKYLDKVCNEIYAETDDYDIGNVYIKIGAKKAFDSTTQDVYFEDLQKQILEQIRLAQFTIWIAVAWFTDRILFRELIKRKNEGLNIQLIIVDDDINKNSGLEFEKYFETHRVAPMGYFGNIVHHKFCVIDFETVIHGSYNWTKKAQYNKETLSIDVNRETAQRFAKEFMKLKQGESVF